MLGRRGQVAVYKGLKNANTVTAISGTTLNGVRGLWAIDGKLQYARQ